MTTPEPNNYEDGQIVNGWRYVATDNTWVQATQPGQPYTNEYGLIPATPKPTPWGKIIGFGAAGVVGLLVLAGGCGAILASTSTPAPQAAQPAPVQPAPVQPAPVEPAPVEPPSNDYEDLADVALESAWDQQSASDQETVCNAWNLGAGAQEVILDQFAGAVSATTITRSDIRAFFNRKC